MHKIYQSKMSTLSAEKRVHRTALALNNEAVCVLRQGRYETAKHMLSQCLTIMETLILTMQEQGDENDDDEDDNNCEDENNNSGEGDKSNMLLLRSLEYAASKCRMEKNASGQQQTIRDGYLFSPSLSASLFEVYPMDDCDLCEMRSALQYGYSPTVFFPNLLRDEQEQDEDQQQELMSVTLSRQYALVLYNTALAYILCQECQEFFNRQIDPLTQPPTAADRKKVHQAAEEQKKKETFGVARRLLLCSDSVLSSVVMETARQERSLSFSRARGGRHRRPCPQGEDSNRDAHRRPINFAARVQLMLSSGVVLSCLSFCLLECRQYEQSNMALRAVENMMNVLDSQYSTIFAPTYLSPAA